MKHFLPCLVALLPAPVLACTLWAAAGDDADGGTLISKNRDWKPDHHQVLKQVHPKKGYAYFGLYAEGNNDPGLKAGTNEKGLTIISASSNIPKKVRLSDPGKHGIMTNILTDYASVDAVMADADMLFGASRANFFMIADHSKILVAEVGLGGKYAIKVVNKGTATHTNHYIEPSLAGQFGDKAGKSSSTRYARINELLAQAPRPLTTEQFATLSRDHHDGPDNSLWRDGHEFTLASWIVRMPVSGAPHLRVVVANPGETESTQEFMLDDAFWKHSSQH